MRVMRGEGLAGGSAETSLATARPFSSPHGSERHWSARQRLPRSKVSRWFDETVRSHRADNRLGLRRPGRAILASRCLVASAASWRRILANSPEGRFGLTATAVAVAVCITATSAPQGSARCVLVPSNASTSTPSRIRWRRLPYTRRSSASSVDPTRLNVTSNTSERHLQYSASKRHLWHRLRHHEFGLGVCNHVLCADRGRRLNQRRATPGESNDRKLGDHQIHRPQRGEG